MRLALVNLDAGLVECHRLDGRTYDRNHGSTRNTTGLGHDNHRTRCDARYHAVIAHRGDVLVGRQPRHRSVDFGGRHLGLEAERLADEHLTRRRGHGHLVDGLRHRHPTFVPLALARHRHDGLTGSYRENDTVFAHTCDFGIGGCPLEHQPFTRSGRDDSRQGLLFTDRKVELMRVKGYGLERGVRFGLLASAHHQTAQSGKEQSRKSFHGTFGFLGFATV